MSVITLHELAHHVVEECIVKLGEDYLAFRADEDNRKIAEGLCEYTAFALLGAGQGREFDPSWSLRGIFPDSLICTGGTVYGTLVTYLEYLPVPIGKNVREWISRFGYRYPLWRMWEWRELRELSEEHLLSLTFLHNELRGRALPHLIRVGTEKRPIHPRPMRYWLSILYRWWGRSGQQNPYRPRIDPRIWSIVGSHYVNLLMEHLEGREPLTISLNTKAIHKPDIIWETIEFV